MLAFLLDGLHEDLNRITKKPYVEEPDYCGQEDATAAIQAWQRHLLRDQSVIVDLFQGQMKSTVGCLNRKCGHVRASLSYVVALLMKVILLFVIPSAEINQV